MKYYLVAGEASGDLHGANLMRELKKLDPQAEFRFWGGDLMQAQGGEMVSHYKERAYMGFLEVVKHLGTILGFIKQCKQDIFDWKPDVLILIDYPGFNLRIAEFAKQHGIPVHYYISPQIWAWKENRVKQIKRFVDEMYVILPFEESFYNKWEYKVHFVGHPLLDALKDFKPEPHFKLHHGLDHRPVIALLPGSRKQELTKMLGEMLKVIPYFPKHQFVIAGAPSQPVEFYESLIPQEIKNSVKIISNKTYDLLSIAEAALVTSGTATLETALFEVPEVVCYKGSQVSYLIAKQLVKNIKYISLVNLVMDRELVRELIQSDMTAANLKTELAAIIEGGSKRPAILQGYKELKDKLGNEGASAKTAGLIYGSIKVTGVER
ncbi:MAG TPA: lipid-A-disaccharide synthase [Bacteroidia bacterium]|nr:lipid-A-disaccharide synthase [Bacteroidia bacterium]